jgi:3-oxoacyl-[acyl-carrier protein] reductase
MRERIDFAGKTVVVTGGASDVGKAVANEFAVEGADVVIADIDDERGEEAIETITEEHGCDGMYIHANLTDLGACKELMSTVVDEFGGVDVTVNMAAVAAPSKISKPFLKETPDDWRPQLEVTIMGIVNPTYAALEQMADTDGGSIINFSSESHRGQDERMAMYSAAKSAVATFSQTLAKETGQDGVRVNALSPSATQTETTKDFMEEHGDAVGHEHALNRLGEPQDHADAAVFLASDAADWITGQVLSVNGGYL